MSVWGNSAYPENDIIGREETIEHIKFIFLEWQIKEILKDTLL